MHPTGVNVAPPIAKTVGIISLDIKTLGRAVLENGDRIILPFQQQFDRFGPELGSVKTIEEDRSSASLGVANLTSEDRFAGRVTAAIKLKIAIANHLYEFVPERFGSTAQRDIASRIGGLSFCTEFTTLLIDNPFAANDHHIFL